MHSRWFSGRHGQLARAQVKVSEQNLPARALRKFALAAGLATALSGCAVGPNYHRPIQHMPAAWTAPPTTQASVTVQQPLPVERWWTTFNDPELDSLVRRAVASNLDVELATERVVEARAMLQSATAGLFPVINTSASYRRSFSATGGSVIVTGGGGGTGTVAGGTTGTTGGTGGGTRTVGPRPRDLWQGGFDAAWELDVFGGVRRSIEAGRADIQASIENRRNVLVTLLGDVATDYLLVRGFQQEIKISQQNLDADEHTVGITRQKVQVGTATQLDVVTAQAEVATIRAQIASFVSQEYQAIYSLSVLLGQEPTALQQELSATGPIPVTPPVVPVGLPSELLRRRPDIRQAERQLAAETARIGVAVAQLFPRFSLTGTLTLSGSRYEALTNWGTRFWSFGPSFTWPIFDAGKLWAAVDVQESVRAQALTTYRKTVLTALQDVENALVSYSEEQQRRAALADAVAANQRALALAQQQYQFGQTDFLRVLDAERSLYGSQDALVLSNRAVATDLVALYKALGGGWEIGEEPPTTQPVAQ